MALHFKGFRPERAPFLSLVKRSVVNIEDEALKNVDLSLSHNPSTKARRKIAEFSYRLRACFIVLCTLMNFDHQNR